MTIRPDPDSFARALAVLAARDLARPSTELATALRLAAYREGHRAGGPAGTRAFATPMDAGLARLRALRASHAALSRPGLLTAPATGPDNLNGIDVSPAALAAFARRHVAAARGDFEAAARNGFIAAIRDAAAPVPEDTAGFEARYLALRFLGALDPDAHARRVRADPERLAAARLVAGWWADRLPAGTDGTRLSAFRDRLTESVALTGVEEIDVGYGPDAWLQEALDEAGLTSAALDRWRKSVAWIHPRAGTVLARAGLGAPVETLGSYREAERAAHETPAPTAGAPGPLDVAAFLIEASVPNAILRRIPGALAVALPAEAGGEPTCLFLVPAGSGLRALDDGRTLARIPGGSEASAAALARAGLVASAGEIRLDLASLDGIGPRLLAMGAAIRSLVEAAPVAGAA